MTYISLATGLAAALLANTASASINAMNLNETGSASNRALVVNNCPYPVYLWSILKGQGCPPNEAVVLNTGEFYHEKFREPENDIGVSIKISKTDQCKGVDITQLEYFLETRRSGFNMNYLDVSYVDCNSGKKDCPGRKDGYYLKSGNTGRATVADASNTRCPTFSCTDADSCDKTSYVEWDDVQTKTCDLDAPLDFYLCGQTPQEGSGSEPSSKPEPAPSSSEEEPEEETPAPTKTPEQDIANVKAAEVTPAPEAPKHTKTEVVYVTQFEYVHAKRHAHNHVHKHFRA